MIKGLDTIKAASIQIEKLKEVINGKKVEVEELMVDIREKAALIKTDTDKAKAKAEEVEKDANIIMKNKEIVEREKANAEEKLKESQPILEEALAALGKVSAKEIDEIAK